MTRIEIKVKAIRGGLFIIGLNATLSDGHEYGATVQLTPEMLEKYTQGSDEVNAKLLRAIMDFNNLDAGRVLTPQDQAALFSLQTGIPIGAPVQNGEYVNNSAGYVSFTDRNTGEYERYRLDGDGLRLELAVTPQEAKEADDE